MFVNFVVLVGVVFFFFVEVYKCFKNLELIDGFLMFGVVLIGFFVNLILVFLFYEYVYESMNVCFVYLYFLSDMFFLVVVVIGGIVII